MAKKQNVEAKAAGQPATETTLELTVKERILISDFFPERGGLTDQWISKDIAQKVDFSPAERKDLNLRVVQGPGTSGRWLWEDKKERLLIIPLSTAEIQFLKDQVERINRTAVPGEKGFTMDTAELAKKIKAL